MERRKFLALTCAASVASLLPAPLAAGESLPQNGRSVSCNAGWQFYRIESSQSAEDRLFSGQEFKAQSWEMVDLPHTARVEVESPNLYFQGICWYRKRFATDPSWKGKKVALKFEAAMQLADVWVNGKHKLTHLGGYLPFMVDLTNDLNSDSDNVIAVRLDNRDNPSFPLGRPARSLDFSYFGGLYRDVNWIVTDRLHITDPVAANSVASGGVFISYPEVTPESAMVQIKTHVANEHGSSKSMRLKTVIVDSLGKLAGVAVDTDEIGMNGTRAYVQQIRIEKPELWHMDHPKLYQVLSQVWDGDRLADEVVTRIGIRKLDFDHKRGFFINGEPVRLRGTNRHMAYPYVGNAASDRAQYRDAVKLKEAGFHYLRLPHYPHAPAFLDACDELGLLVIDPIPGWQFFQNTESFKSNVFENIRDMIRRDRNHPCVMIFETCLNETYGPTDDFWRQCHAVAHEEFDGAAMYTGGDSYGKQNYSRPLWDVPWNAWDDDSFSRPALYSMQKGIDREYGDYEFGGNESTSRVARGASESDLLLQAWNYQWSHNRNRGNAWSFGDSSWVGIDHYRGYAEFSPISRCGALDVFRIPKFVYYFYASQRRPDVVHSASASGPMVYIANYWTQRPSSTKVVVYSNCDEVELFLNGRSIARQKPDSGPTTGYLNPRLANPNYWKEHPEQIQGAEEIPRLVGATDPADHGAEPFSGGNCRNVERAPFTFFNVPYETGTLLAKGYYRGKLAGQHERRTPGKPAALRIVADLSGRELAADGADFLFVWVEVIDSAGTVVPSFASEVFLEATGEGELIGPQRIKAEAGIAPFMLRSRRKAGGIVLQATASELHPDSLRLRSVAS
jgi:beta-galactosidase